MKLRFLIFIRPLLIACTASRHSKEPTQITPTPSHSSRTTEAFRFIGSETTIQQVTAKVGMPDRDVGSGIYVYAYLLGDGTNVLIGSADSYHILYVRHGTEVLYEKR